MCKGLPRYLEGLGHCFFGYALAHFARRFGMMAGQMKTFFDATGALWQAGALHGKPASIFTSAATQCGGHETTLLTSGGARGSAAFTARGLLHGNQGQHTQSYFRGPKHVQGRTRSMPFSLTFHLLHPEPPLCNASQ